MFCLRPLCGVVFGPVVLTAGGAAFLGTLAALAACAAAEPGRLRDEKGAERPAAAGEAEPAAPRRRRGRAL